MAAPATTCLSFPLAYIEPYPEPSRASTLTLTPLSPLPLLYLARSPEGEVELDELESGHGHHGQASGKLPPTPSTSQPKPTRQHTSPLHGDLAVALALHRRRLAALAEQPWPRHGGHGRRTQSLSPAPPPA